MLEVVESDSEEFCTFHLIYIDDIDDVSEFEIIIELTRHPCLFTFDDELLLSTTSFLQKVNFEYTLRIIMSHYIRNKT